MKKFLLKIIMLIIYSRSYTQAMENAKDDFYLDDSQHKIETNDELEYRGIFHLNINEERACYKKKLDIFLDDITEKLSEDFGNLFFKHRNIIEIFPYDKPTLIVSYKILIEPENTNFKLTHFTEFLYIQSPVMSEKELEQFDQFNRELDLTLKKLTEELEGLIAPYINIKLSPAVKLKIKFFMTEIK